MIKVCFSGHCTFSFKSERAHKVHFDLVYSKYQRNYEKIILYVNSIVNFNIWKFRNKIFHENETFDILKLLNKISASMFARKNIEKVEDRLTSCKKIEYLTEFQITFGSIKDAMFDPG